MYSRSTSKNSASNLDGWDTYRSDNIVIQNSYLDHDDDCVSFKPNSTNILIQGLVCNSSHGISVGSLGQYPGVFDVVENLFVYNVSLSNATDGARLKVWPGADVEKPPGWIGGGGAGIVRNVTYDTFYNVNNDGAIKIDQCYGAVSAAECEADPSLVILTDVTFRNFFGTTSKKFDPVVGSLICSSPDVSRIHGRMILVYLLTLASLVTTFKPRIFPLQRQADGLLSGSADIRTRACLISTVLGVCRAKRHTIVRAVIIIMHLQD